MKRDEWLRRVRDLSQRLASNDELDAVLPAILDAAIELTDAERGFLVLVEGTRDDGSPKSKVVEARGFDQASLRGGDAKISRTVIRRALGEERAVVTRSDTVDADVMQVSSVQEARVRSIACVPMKLRGETQGALYLDHRFVGDAFSEDDLPLLEVFAGQAALALQWARLAEEARARKQTLAAPAPGEGSEPAPPPGKLSSYGRLVGASPAMNVLYEEIERAARSEAPVLVLGETGTGHEAVARELHARGPAADAPFLMATCAVASRELADRLFGTLSAPGLIEQAGEGTVFLDDVDELTPDMQTRLLEVLRRGVWPGLAGDLPLRARLVAASHADLRALVDQGELREDLYYRLDVMRIIVPPLRQRHGDVPLLLASFLDEGESAPEVSDRALRLLSDYAWPGNVRELRNEAQRLLAAGARRVSGNHLSEAVRAGGGVTGQVANFSGLTLKQIEAQVVQRALEEAGGSKARAARQLGVPRSTLYHLIDRHGLG